MSQPQRTPYSHKIRYGVTGAPIITEDEMDGSHAPGVGIAPTLIELVYSAAQDSLPKVPASVSASVTGWWTRFGKRDQYDHQVITHFANGPEGWPAWLAAEARLHDPERPSQPPADRTAAALAEVRRLCDMTIAVSVRADAIDQAQDTLAAIDRVMGDTEAPLSRYYEHPTCGFHWHGRDGMDIPMRDGEPVCPRCELRRLAAPADGAAVCICEHTEAQHFEDACLACDCGDYLPPSAAREVIARYQEGVKGMSADRGAVLREVADWLKAWRPEFFERWAVAEQDRYEGGVDDAADALRRLADETPAATHEADGLRCVCGDPVQLMDDDDPISWIHSPGSDTRCLEARPRCPHCQLPHDLKPGSMPVRACGSILASLAEAKRLHGKGDHSRCARVDCEVVRDRAAEEADRG